MRGSSCSARGRRSITITRTRGRFSSARSARRWSPRPGWSDYYKDPYYDTFFTQAAGHNTLLVDGNPASQDIADTAQFAALNRHPRITDATLSPFYDAVGSDLTPVYRGRLESYTRRLAYMKPDYLIVFDRVRTKALPAALRRGCTLLQRAG